MNDQQEGLTPDKWDKHAEACARMRQAEEGLLLAMAELKGAAAAWVRAESEAAGGGVRPVALVGIAASNAATWPCGCLSGNNIIETAKRNAALELLRRSLG